MSTTILKIHPLTITNDFPKCTLRNLCSASLSWNTNKNVCILKFLV